jgi:hypothetical protein
MTVNVSDWSETPDSNTTVNAVYIGPNAPPANVDNGMRSIMAGVKTLSLTIPATATFMPKSGGVFTAAITFTGAGAFRYNVDPTLVSGRDFHLVEGSARPASPAEGDRAFYYTA